MRYILAAVAIALATPAVAAGVSPSDLSIGGVATGATEASVLRRLGAPAQRVDNGEGIELHYPGFVVTVAWLEQRAPGRQRRVIALYATGPKACTSRGLCPGMTESTATGLYGHVEPTRRETGIFLEYQPAGLSCWLQVAPAGGVVQSVAVAASHEA